MNAGVREADRRRAARETRRGKSRKAMRLKLDRKRDTEAKLLRGRTAPPVEYKGVTRFSEEAERYGPVGIVRLARDCGLLDELLARTNYRWGGRKRIEGHWVLAYLAFVNSKFADIQPWLTETSAEMWWEAGFAGRPRYPTVYRRFVELEELAVEDFFEASSGLVKLAIEKSGGRVGFDLIVDCTESETNARLHHDCQPGDGCPGITEFITNRHGRSVQKNARVVAAASTQEAKAHREVVNASAFPDDPDQARALSGDVEEITYEDNADCVRVRVAGHWFRLGDPEAGVRAYTRGDKKLKFWAGYYNLKVTCVYYGAPILNIVEAADEQEWNLFDEVIARTELICGPDHVRAFLADRGFAVKPVYEACTKRNITLVAPLRAEAGDDGAPRDRDEFDRDGNPRCKHCGGPTEFVRFAGGEKPRVWFRCARPYPLDEDGKPTDRCAKDQSISASKDWRYLIPLWRNTDAYQALNNLSFAFERAHHAARRRNNVAGKDEATRPRRVGRLCQQLRANAGVTLDWLKIGDRMGHFDGSVLRLTHKDDVPSKVTAEDFVKRMEAERRAEGLLRPYGKAAARLGIGPKLPERKVVRDADRDDIDVQPATEEESDGAVSRSARLDTSRDLGDTRWGSDPPERPPDRASEDDLPF
ncbi:MAG: hypothetical protein ACXVFK_04795 [Solirubrobacteraceae bacterium]